MADQTVETKTTEFSDGGTITETVTTETEYEPGEDHPSETVAEIVEEIVPAVEGDISDAVAIAAIETQGEVEIATIQAEVQIAAIEAEAERERSWQEEVEVLHQNMRELRAAMEPLLQGHQSTPPASAAEVEEIMGEEILTPPSMSEETSETETEVTQRNEEESPAPVPARAHRKRRLI